MAESVYKVVELIGTSTASWEKAAAAAVKMASESLRDLRVAEISELDMQIIDGKVLAYRAKVKLSFKYTPGGESTEGAPVAKSARAKSAPAKAEGVTPTNGPRKAKRRPAKR
jgi:flavin-binding protein dodecin